MIDKKREKALEETAKLKNVEAAHTTYDRGAIEGGPKKLPTFSSPSIIIIKQASFFYLNRFSLSLSEFRS